MNCSTALLEGKLSLLNLLADEIGVIYESHLETYNFTANKVNDIKERILNGTFTFSPLRIRAFHIDDEPELAFGYTFYCKNNPINYTIYSTQEDNLVQIAIGYLLTKVFLMKNNSKTFTQKNAYYESVCAEGNVLRLYKFDLINTLMTKNRKDLLSYLSDIVMNHNFMELVEQYIYLPIQDKDGIDITSQIGCCIPPVGPITEVVMNQIFKVLDNEFKRLYPSLSYNRLVYQVLVSVPKTYSSQLGIKLECENIFKEQVLTLFDQIDISGNIDSIGPGDRPLLCQRDQVFLSKEGEIQVQIKDNKEQ